LVGDTNCGVPVAASAVRVALLEEDHGHERAELAAHVRHPGAEGIRDAHEPRLHLGEVRHQGGEDLRGREVTDLSGVAEGGALPLLDICDGRWPSEGGVEASPQVLQIPGERRDQRRPSQELEQRPAVHVVLVIGRAPR
jgi:hypothetical protein